MVWAMRRGLALVLVCAPACARGVSLEGSGDDETIGTSSVAVTDPASPTGTPADTTTPEDTSDSDSTSTGDEMPTDPLDDTGPGDDTTTTGPELPHPELYPYDRVHSPITAFTAERMRGIPSAMGTMDTVFAKVGGTTTASANFMQCLADVDTIMELPPELQATRTHFNVDLGGGVTPYTRESAAALVDGTSTDVGAGLVATETAAILPRFAHVLVGTHDLAGEQPAALFTFADKLLDIVDQVMTGGAVPILSTLPQRTDVPEKLPFIPRYNAVIRAVAQGRQVPLVDLNLALAGAPNFGLRDDGVDLSAFVSADVERPCFFNEAGLAGGYNVRNLESMRALDRAKQVVVDMVPELDAPQPGLRGSGTVDDPYIIPSLPFVDLRSTADSTSDLFASYGGACDPMIDESGPEVLYKLEVDDPIDLRVMVFDRGGVDVDVHVLSAPDPATCLKRNDKEVTGPLEDGDFTIVVDSYAGEVPSGAAGEYVIVVLADD